MNDNAIKDFGPESDISYTLPESLLSFIRTSTSYIGKLSLFDKYIVWRYTIGSAAINYNLIFGKPNVNGKYWCFLFFLYFYNTYLSPKASEKRSIIIPVEFINYDKYFLNPKIFLKEATEDEVVHIINMYTGRLQLIINKCPTPKKEIIVYKVSSKYPGIPENLENGNVGILQLPFNSTTIDPHFNFAPFVTETEGEGCCFFRIHIPKGAHCLYIPKEFHAYPFENEVLLPNGITFEVFDIYTSTYNYIPTSSVNIDLLQDVKDIVIGPVYEIRGYNGCKGTTSVDKHCKVESKKFKVFEATLIALNY